jgi:hypothetical protein
MRNPRAPTATNAMNTRTRCTHDTRARKISCASNRIGVKSAPMQSCSIALTNKHRSITTLNADSHSFRSIVSPIGRIDNKTLRSCGIGSLQKSSASFPAPTFNAGLAPAFSLRAPHRAARRAEFISVSGPRSDRSAPRSDMRLKRTSGVVAATEQPFAPMNSPLPRTACGNRVSI